MANTDIKSSFELELKSKGAGKVKKDINDISAGLSKKNLTEGMEALDAVTSRSVRQLSGMSKHIKDVTKSLGGMAKTIKSVAKLTDDLRKLKDGVTPGSGGGGGTQQPRSPKRGAFLQGLGQGMGFGPYLQRGPGMGRQAFGMGVGGAARSIASMPVRGSQAFAQGLASIPGGGMVTAMMSQALGSFQSAQAYQESLMGLGGINRFPGNQAAAGARSRVMGRGIGPIDRAAIRARLSQSNGPNLTSAGLAFAGRTGSTGVLNPGTITPSGLSGGGLTKNQQDLVEAEVQRITATKTATLQKIADRAAATARANAMRPEAQTMGSIGAVRRTGISMGFTPQQSLQMASQMGLSTMDGSLNAARGAMGSLFGLQRLGYGGANEAGAFARAGRRGGIQGVSGSGGSALDETVGRAIAQGMDRSETRELLAQIAQGQDRFFSTGIVFARSTIQDLTDGLGGPLGPGARSSRTAAGLAQSMQQVGMQGPQNAAQGMMVRMMMKNRGLNPTSENMFSMLEELQSGNFSGQDINKTLGAFNTGGGAQGRFFQKMILGQLGAQVTSSEAGKIAAMGIGGRSTRGSSADLAGLGAGITPGMSKRSAGMEMSRVNQGMRMASSVQNFEEGIIRGGDAFAKLAPTIDSLSRGSLSIAEKLPLFGEALQKFIDMFGADNMKLPKRIRTNGE